VLLAAFFLAFSFLAATLHIALLKKHSRLDTVMGE
jgi:hypothetical protein